jgi:Domain of unknown function (DUF4062)
MSFDARVIKVFIASPSDVIRERVIVRDVIASWNSLYGERESIFLLAIGWETNSYPMQGKRPQEIINDQILDSSDILIGIFWTRLGSPTGKAPSGTAEEIDEFISSNKPVMLYFSAAPVRPDSVDNDQYSALKALKEEYYKSGLVESFSTPEEFGSLLQRQLTQMIFDKFSLRQSDVSENLESKKPISLSDNALQLLQIAANNDEGTIISLSVIGGNIIQSGEVTFVQPGSKAREVATVLEAIVELEGKGLIESADFRREVFTVTAAGYRAIDSLPVPKS